ncbi:hypothetical protein EDB80DRAFT_867046 [Ilyonectria destructans]|nr:hypothetical protein EDB80DRAFT_867046 [Ilyonectria destructans]
MSSTSTTPVAAAPAWNKEPGLHVEQDVKHIPMFQICSSVAQALPTIATVKKHADKDYIIVSMRFEDICMAKILEKDGSRYQYNPETECGFVCLDLRTLKTRAPGDRASSWFKSMTKRHLIIEEYRTHFEHTCKARWHHTSPYLFAFGKSQLSNRTPEEVKANALRQIIFVTWDPALEERTLGRLQLPWFHEPNVKLWDMQMADLIRRRFGRSEMKAEYALEGMGIRFIDQCFGDISHCAANDAVLLMQLTLACAYSDDGQKAKFVKMERLPWLNYGWSWFTMDKINTPPDQPSFRRPESQLNDNEVDHVENPSAWKWCIRSGNDA